MMLSSCVYPFEVDLEGESGMMVIEGDILIGEIMPVNVSYTAPVGSTEKDIEYPSATVWVEDDRGGSYLGKDSGKGSYEVDVREADPALKYRLRVKNRDTSREYVSEWQEVHRAAMVDSLSYRMSESRDMMFIGLSMHSMGESWFRWRYDETWEFHSRYYSVLDYSKPTSANKYGYMFDRPDEENIYYCWSQDESKDLMLFSTETQSEDRFEDLEFHAISRDDRKISSLYHMEVSLQAISKDAYIYWNNVKSNSEYNGSLFVPNPSEMSGNIRCVNDSTEFVLGYISASCVARNDIYIDNAVTRFYKNPPASEEEIVDARNTDWERYSKLGWIPIEYPDKDGNPSVVTWGQARCVDCRAMGGSKKKPEGWPTNHI